VAAGPAWDDLTVLTNNLHLTINEFPSAFFLSMYGDCIEGNSTHHHCREALSRVISTNYPSLVSIVDDILLAREREWRSNGFLF
jgi:hypothetical protein